MLTAFINDELTEIKGAYCNLCKCPLSAKVRSKMKNVLKTYGKNNYDFICSIDYDLFMQLLKRGLLPIKILDYKVIYEDFINQKQKQSVVITHLSEKYNCHENTIRNIIKFMQC